MRILFVHNRYARRGGEDEVVDTEMAQLRAAGHQVKILDPRSADLTIVRAGFELATLAWNPLAAASLRASSAQFQPDIVHVHNVFPRLGPSLLHAVRRLGLPLVMTLHNYRWLCPQGTFTRAEKVCRLCANGNFTHGVRHACLRHSRVLTAAYALALTIAYRSGWPQQLAHRLVCLSEAQRSEYLAVGWPAHKLVVKGNFITQVPREPDSPGEGVLFVGRISAEKGPQVLLDAWGHVRPDAGTLSIAGEGPLTNELRRAAPPDVKWLGFLGPTEVAAAMARHACLAVPSICPETFGMVVVQAMALGRPVVASAIGGLPELVRDGETGLLVEAGNPQALAAKLQWLLDHPSERNAMGRRARAFALERFGPKTGLRALEELYDQTIRVASTEQT